MRVRVLAGAAALIAVLLALFTSVASSAVPQEWTHRHSTWIWVVTVALGLLSAGLAMGSSPAPERVPINEASIQARDVTGPVVLAQPGATVRIENSNPAPPAPQRGEQVVVGELPGAPPAFVERDVVARLADVLADGGGIAAVSALTGSRGAGKTQVAAQYAREAVAQGIELVAWVSAHNHSRMLAGLAEVARRVGVADPEGDSEISARRLRDALAARSTPSVLVFDNATDPDMIRRYLPATGTTRVIITSIDHAFASLGADITVDSFDRSQSLVYLRARTGLHVDDGADRLAEELGDLPLALAQAATVIKLQGQTYDVYLDRLRSLPMDTTLPADRGDSYPHGVARAVTLSVKAVEDADAEGMTHRVIATAAVLDSSGVSRGLLSDLAEAPSGQDLDETLAHLVESSLMVWGEDGQAIVMHRLIARTIRDQIQAAGDLQDLIVTSTGRLQRLLPAEDRAWEHREDGIELVAQALALWENAVDASDRGAMTLEGLETTANLAIWAVAHLTATADLSRAIDTGAAVVASCEKALGPDHPATISSRNNLAVAYQSAGRLDQAIGLHKETRPRPPSHPHLQQQPCCRLPVGGTA